ENPRAAVRSRRPLREAKVVVSDVEGNPGWYRVDIMVRRHFKYMGAAFTLSLAGKLDKSSRSCGMKVDIKGLLQRLNPACTRALEGASGMCVNRGQYEVTVEHRLLLLCDSSHGDIALLFKQCDVEAEPLATELQRRIEGLRGGNPGKPVFAATLLQWLEDGWLLASLELGESAIRSAALLLAL